MHTYMYTDTHIYVHACMYVMGNQMSYLYLLVGLKNLEIRRCTFRNIQDTGCS